MTGTYKPKWAVYLGMAAVAVVVMVVWPHSRSRLGMGTSSIGNPAIGTTGRVNAAPEDSPATVHDLDTVLRTVDQNELIGRRVDFHVRVADLNDYTSFWVGNKDNRMLVVPGRDNPPMKVGQTARITGSIERAPKDQEVYIRADNVIPEG